MELVVIIFVAASSFFMGVVFSPRVKKLFRKEQRALTPSAVVYPPVPTRKPGGAFSEYTIEELERHKKFLEREIKSSVHYPSLRSHSSGQLKSVLEMLAWHYDQDGTREFLEERERNRKDLAEFDQKYNQLLKGGK